MSAAAAMIGFWNAQLALGVFAGAWWNAASLWCLARLLSAWLGPTPSRRRAISWPHHPSSAQRADGDGEEFNPAPSKWARDRRVVGWLLIKFPLLYAIVFVVLRTPTMSVIGFGLGFSAVLVCAIGSFVLHAQPLATTRSYGR